MAFESELIKSITKLDKSDDRKQYVISIMKYGSSVQLVKQEWWYDDAVGKHKPGKLKGLQVADLRRLDEIGLDRIISVMNKHSK